jgi:hypothetical protein
VQLTLVIFPVNEDPPESWNVLPESGGLGNMHAGKTLAERVTFTGRTIVTVVPTGAVA